MIPNPLIATESPRADGERGHHLTIRIPRISGIFALENVIPFFHHGWEWTKATLSIISSIIVEPALDPQSLRNLSILLMLFESLSSFCLARIELEARIALTQMDLTIDDRAFATPIMVLLQDLQEEHNDTYATSISPLVGVFGTISLVLSCLANSCSNNSLLNPERFTVERTQQQQQQQQQQFGQNSSFFTVYALLGLFCVESALFLSILFLAGQALFFPHAFFLFLNGAASSSNIFLTGFLWMASLVGSHLLRRQLYHNLGA
jgi:hypothetical protein